MGGQEIIHNESSGKNAENIPDVQQQANEEEIKSNQKPNPPENDSALDQKEESEEQIINNKKRIADFRQKIATAQNESLGRYKKRIVELEKRNIRISKRIESLKSLES